MTPDELTPDEFARLVALPEDHPERRPWQGSALFESRLRMHQQFVTGEDAPSDAADRAGAERELGARLARVLATEHPPHEPGHGEGTRERVLEFRTDGKHHTRGTDGRTRAHTRGAVLALAAGLVVVAAATWIVMRPPEPRAVRGAGGAERLVLAEPRGTTGAADLEWTAVPEADHYEVVFYGSDLNEITRVKDLVLPRFELRAGALPAGLSHGEDVLAGVIAMHAGDPIATSKTRALHVP
jgi:hypothetical protein